MTIIERHSRSTVTGSWDAYEANRGGRGVFIGFSPFYTDAEAYSFEMTLKYCGSQPCFRTDDFGQYVRQPRPQATPSGGSTLP